MKNRYTSYIRRCLAMLPALPVICLGVSLWIVTGLGCDPFTTLHEGLARQVGVSVGTANLICNVSIFVLFLFLDRKMVGFGSVVMAFGLGPIIDLWCNMLRSVLPDQPPLWLLAVLSLAGSVIVGFGAAYYIPLNVGYQPIDMAGLYIGKLFHRTLGFGMMIFNAVALVAGMAMGATFGVATIINLVAIGYIINFAIPISGPVACKLGGIPFTDINKENTGKKS